MSADKPSLAEAIATFLKAKSDLELAVWIRDEAGDTPTEFDAEAAVEHTTDELARAEAEVAAAVDRRIKRYLRDVEVGVNE